MSLLLIILIVLLFCVLVIYRPPFILIRLLSFTYPDILWYVKVRPSSDYHQHAQTIALTIDDAPTSYTLDILAVLRAYNARATFFIIGSHVKGREEILRAIVREGHELGNHTMYDVPSKNLAVEELKESIEATDKIICEALATENDNTGESGGELNHDDAVRTKGVTSFFRPGSGFFTKSMRTLIATHSKRIVLGSIYPHDPIVSSPAANAWHVLSCVRDGGIVVMHDGRSWSAEGLRLVLEGLEKRQSSYEERWDVVGASELLKRGNSSFV